MEWGQIRETCLPQVLYSRSSNVLAPSLQRIAGESSQIETHAQAPASSSLELVTRFVLGDWGRRAINKKEPFIIHILRGFVCGSTSQNSVHVARIQLELSSESIIHQALWHRPITPVTREAEKDLSQLRLQSEFKVSLGNLVRSCFKIKRAEIVV